MGESDVSLKALRTICKMPLSEGGIQGIEYSAGEFPEWFNGESFTNEGMHLSPWVAPKVLWAVIEGLCGIQPTEEGIQVNPALPTSWKWACLKNVPWSGKEFSIFIAREGNAITVYSNVDVDTPHRKRIFKEEVSDKISVKGNVEYISLKNEGFTICLANPSDTDKVSYVSLNHLNIPVTKAIVKISDGVYKHVAEHDFTNPLKVDVEARSYKVLEIAFQ